MHIKEVTIYSKQVKEVGEFYSKLGANTNEKNGIYQVHMGSSVLSIRPSKKEWTYHLAFNIPFNQIREAKDWISVYADIESFQGKEIVNFPKWGAEAIYFYDPAGNILEFIARKPLQVMGERPFTFESVINISEVGWPVHDVKEAEKLMNLPVYSRFGPAFSALGDAEGMFIVVDANVKKWMPNDDPVQFSPTMVKLRRENQKLLFERQAGVQTFSVSKI